MTRFHLLEATGAAAAAARGELTGLAEPRHVLPTSSSQRAKGCRRTPAFLFSARTPAGGFDGCDTLKTASSRAPESPTVSFSTNNHFG